MWSLVWLVALLVGEAVAVVLAGHGWWPAAFLGILLALALWPIGVLTAGRRFPGRTAGPASGVPYVLAFLLVFPALVTFVVGGDELLLSKAGRVTAVVVTDQEPHCESNGFCWRLSRLTDAATGQDLGWIHPRCDFGNAVTTGRSTTAWVDPTGWTEPLFTACADDLRAPGIAAGIWLGLAGGVVVARLAELGWRLRRRPGDSALAAALAEPPPPDDPPPNG
jgi:hypothetical protein